MDIDASARRHGVSDNDMLHAYRNHWAAFSTERPTVTMFIGPAQNGRPLEIGVVDDFNGEAFIHAMAARAKFLNGPPQR